MLSDLLRNITFKRRVSCTQVSDQGPIGALVYSYKDKRQEEYLVVYCN